LNDDGVSDSFLEALMVKRVETVNYLLANGYRIDCTFKFGNGRTYEDLATAIDFPMGAALIRE
jgi:hypothetical protein